MHNFLKHIYESMAVGMCKCTSLSLLGLSWVEITINTRFLDYHLFQNNTIIIVIIFLLFFLLRAHVIHLLLQLLLASSEKIYVIAKNGDYYNTIILVFVKLYSNTFTVNDDNSDVIAKLYKKLNDLLPKIGETVKRSLLGGSNWAHISKGNLKLELKVHVCFHLIIIWQATAFPVICLFFFMAGHQSQHKFSELHKNH